MTEQEYGTWIKQHAALFQMNTAADQQMFAAWWPLLKRYGAQELEDASNFLATREGKTLYRTEQLAEIRRRITQRRLDRLEQEANSAAPNLAEECSLCGGSGFVIVPHPRFVFDGEWHPNGTTFPTVGIHCQCTRGRKRYEAAKISQEKQREDGKKKPVAVSMHLGQYEVTNPGWQGQMTDRKKAEADEERARMAAGAAHAQHGPIDVAIAEVRKRIAKGNP